MKVLIETDAVGGVWTFSLTLARGLLAAGHAVDLAVVGPSYEAHRAAAVPAGVAVHHWAGPLEWEPGALSDPETGEDDDCAIWLAELAVQCGADVVQACSYRHGAADALRDAGVPLILTAHSDVVTWWRSVLGSDPPPEYDAYRRTVARALSRTETLVAPTAAYARQLADAYPQSGRAASDFDVVHNGVEPSPINDPPERSGVVTLGRLHDAGKNITVLKQAAEQLGSRLTLVGPASPDDRAAMTAARWTGALDPAAVGRELDRATIYAGPSLYEPFGLAPLEAAARGCALVLADLPTFREVWADAARYVDPADPDAWADALTTLADDPTLHREAGEQARRRAARYTADATVAAYLGLYHANVAVGVSTAGATA